MSKKRYTWEEKIDNLAELAKAAGRLLNAEAGTDYYNDACGHLFAVYAEFCEWRHDEPYLADEIRALLKQELFIDELTGVRLVVERDIPEHPRMMVVCPEHHMLSFEQVNAAVGRLQQRVPDLSPIASLHFKQSS